MTRRADAGHALGEYLASREAHSDEHDTWENLLARALAGNGESWADVEAHTLSEAELRRPFPVGFGRVCRSPFTLWTVRHVYFPVSYDGRESVGFLARHPDGRPTAHRGGG